MKERYAIDHLREAEIGHLDDRRSIICEQDVVGLQITRSTGELGKSLGKVGGKRTDGLFAACVGILAQGIARLSRTAQ